MSDRKYEYELLGRDSQGAERWAALNRDLAEWAADGWEPIGVSGDDHWTVVLGRRPLAETDGQL